MHAMDGFPYIATLVTAIASGLVAGAFLVFSNFVMQALRRLPPAQGMTAMQTINVTVINPLFMTLVFGTGLVCIVLAVLAAVGAGDWESAPVIAGGLLYAVGTVGVTIAGNVPLNDRLERTRPDEPGSNEFWAEYLTRWTRWNTVRTIAALVAAVVLTLASSS
jgi:uncharacterized membrane protein